MNNNYCDINKRISYISRNEYMYFLNKCNVIGVGLGYKIKNGFNTCIKCIKVFVIRKISLDKIPLNSVIPKMYRGVPTDVVESGYIVGNSLTQRIRPTICGYSIGPEGILNALTLGCIVTDGNQRFILTCNHGIIKEGIKVGSKVLQPGVNDGGKLPEDDVGVVSKFIKIKPISFFKKPNNFVDACIVGVLDNRLVIMFI